MPSLQLGLGTHMPNRALFRGVLDDFGGAAAAFSLEKLRTGVDNVVRVRRSSDDTEQDFNATEVVNGELTGFCGAGDGFVTTWYDQSGNGRNATQATDANQPQIVASGALVTGGIDFDGTNDHLSVDALASVASGTDKPVTMISIFNPDSVAVSVQAIAGFSNNTTDMPLRYQPLRNAVFAFDERDDAATLELLSGGTATASTNNIISSISDGNSRVVRGNGTQVDSGITDLGDTTLTRFTIGALDRTTTGVYFSGKVPAVIVYPSDESSNIAAIEAKLADIYGITLA